MGESVKEIVGLAAAIVVLAGLSVAIINGDKTAAVVKALGSSFSSSITAATHPGK